MTEAEQDCPSARDEIVEAASPECIQGRTVQIATTLEKDLDPSHAFESLETIDKCSVFIDICNQRSLVEDDAMQLEDDVRVNPCTYEASSCYSN